MAQLSMKKVTDVQGTFVIPDYQRGYKWQPREVRQLLDDIYDNENERYCLQTIVVHERDGKLRLIDGQQRLTTLLLIRTYLDSQKAQDDQSTQSAGYTLEFSTRERSKDFLDHISEKTLMDGNENPDFWHLVHAYKEIESWFSEDKRDHSRFKHRLDQTFVIWSETNDEDRRTHGETDKTVEEATFNRLNYGKIDLTDAELIKAMFLSTNNESSNELSTEQKLEIALQWDDMERKLQENEFWKFLTKSTQNNTEEDASSTRINLLLDLIAENRAHESRMTFDFFAKQWLSEDDHTPLSDLWNTIHRAYLALCGWFEDQQLYHKVGYLVECDDVAIEEKASFDLFDIYQAWIHSANNAGFHNELDEMIRRSIPLKRVRRDEKGSVEKEHGKAVYDDIVFEDLSYEDPQTKNALLLFNVLQTEAAQKATVTDEASGTARFPFALYKENKWELEHIHAQNSELPTNRNDLIKYAGELGSLLRNGELPLEPQQRTKLLGTLEEERTKLQSNRGKTLAGLTGICEEIVDLIMKADHPEKDLNGTDENRIDNLALLEKRDNILVSNHVFLIKRFFIIQQDRKGKYIPLGTRNAFLKYYTDASDAPSTTDSFNEQHLAWTREDREAYLRELENTLGPYLSTPPAIHSSVNAESEKASSHE